MFDRDTNTNAELARAVQYADQKGYNIAYSNPSFEYWYLLHFAKRYGYIKDSEAVIDILKTKGYLKDYDKNIDYYAELLAHQPEAIRRAKERLEQLYKDNIIILSCDSNPVTTVHQLVEYPNSKRQ